MNQKMGNDYHKNLKKNKGAPEPWCVLPWSHVSIQANGTYRLCCHSQASSNRGILRDKNGKSLHIENTDWDSIINNDTMKSVRKNMLKGKWPEECIRCKREFLSNMNSRNIYERRILAGIIEEREYPNYLKTKELTQADGTISLKDFPISFLDIRFGNLCNLECIMCGPADSSKWYNNYSSLWGKEFSYSGKNIELIEDANGKLKTKGNIFEWSDNPYLWSQIEKNIIKFRRVYIAGGEPLLAKAHYDFLKKCIKRGVAKNLTLEYNSNITNIPKYAWDIWEHFKSVVIGISLDGVGSVNSLIRYPSKWEQIEKNLLLLDNTKENFVIHITPTVSILNIWHLPEFIYYIMKKNYKKIPPWNSESVFKPHPVHRPPYLNINILENKFKKEIKNHFESWKKKISDFNWKEVQGESNGASWRDKVNRSCKILDNYIDFMYTTQYEEKKLMEYRSNFIYVMDKLDKLRGTSWKKILPELYKNTLEWKKQNSIKK